MSIQLPPTVTDEIVAAILAQLERMFDLPDLVGWLIESGAAFGNVPLLKNIAPERAAASGFLMGLIWNVILEGERESDDEIQGLQEGVIPS